MVAVENDGQVATTPRPTFAAIYANELSFLRQSLRWLGVDEIDIEDILQEVLLAVYRGLDGYDPWYPQRGPADESPYGQRGRRGKPVPRDRPDPLKRWLFGIAWRQVSTYRSRAYRRREVCFGAGSTWPFDSLDTTPTPEQGAATDQRGRIVGELLRAIPPDRRVIVVLHDLLDVGVPEIADDLSVCSSTVWSRLRLGRLEFRAAVGRMNKAERTELRGILPVAETLLDLETYRLPVAARVIPQVPDLVRQRLWVRLERAIARMDRRRSAAPPPEPRAPIQSIVRTWTPPPRPSPRF
jgi:RNA polymerase sigma-70 factor (ECF subfamily)